VGSQIAEISEVGTHGIAERPEQNRRSQYAKDSPKGYVWPGDMDCVGYGERSINEEEREWRHGPDP